VRQARGIEGATATATAIAIATAITTVLLTGGLLVACAAEPEPEGNPEPGGRPETAQVRRAAGEVVDGIPTYEERTALHHTNRVRAGMDCGDPGLVCSGAPLRPVQWDHNLGRAAHWFAQHLHDAQCFQHQTCCYLEDVGGGVIQCDAQGYTCPGGSCDYTPDCPGTPTFSRISMFGGSAVAENIAAGNSTAESTLCQWYFSAGHHDNMCTASRGSLGTGHYGGSNCYGHYWVQNFGSNALADGIASGSHWGSASSPDFGAAFYDPGATGPPQRAAVVIDGACHSLSLEYGDDESGTYAANIAVSSGCHAYWFLFESQGGTRYAYPSTGSYLLGAGCGVYTPNQAGADCEGGTGNCSAGDSRSCYTGPAATQGVGACADGTQSCVGGTWGSCQGETLPAAEQCNGVDDDCNGTVDDPCDCTPGDTQPCGSDVGECEAGTQSCQADGTWGTCSGAVEPAPELCDGLDNNCEGTVDENCIPTDAAVPDGALPADGAVWPDGAWPTDAAAQPDGGGPAFDPPRYVGGCHCRQGASASFGRGAPAGPPLLLALWLLLGGGLRLTRRRRRR
jgi:hypothetical protein